METQCMCRQGVFPWAIFLAFSHSKIITECSKFKFLNFFKCSGGWGHTLDSLKWGKKINKSAIICGHFCKYPIVPIAVMSNNKHCIIWRAAHYHDEEYIKSWTS